MSIPILWQNPVSFNQNPLFISQYFSYLDENDKFYLKEYGINKRKVRKWIDFQLVDSKPYNIQLIYRLVNLLFKLFVESGATLRELDLCDYEVYSDYEIYSETFYFLEQNRLFFSRLQDLSLGPISVFNTKNDIALLKILAKNATKISVLNIEEFHSVYESQFHNALICIIKSQEQLRQFSLVGGEEYPTKKFHGVFSALESQKNSLQEVTIDNCYCGTEFKVLMNCKNLEILRIRYCNNVKILEASLNTLEITSYSLDASSIVQILQKSGSLLQRLKLESTKKGIQEELLLLETLKSFCPNITYLNNSYVELSTQLLELIGNLRKLQFLTLSCFIAISEKVIRVKQFAEILPSTLQYLYLIYSDLGLYIDNLFDNCNAPLKNLLIDHLDNEKVKTLIKFCIRKRSLNYVGVSSYFKLDDNIRKELEET